MEIKKSIYTVLALLLFGTAMAQEETGLGNGTTITGTGSRPIEPAYRLTISPKIIDTTINTNLVDYPLLNLKHETSTDVGLINPAAINIRDVLSPLYNTYVKVGLGTEFMPLGEIYYDSDRSRRLMYGGHLKHLSSFGNISGYAPAQFDRTGVNLYGGLNERRYSLRGDVHYNNQGLHYYAIPIDTLIKDSIAQRYSDFGFSGSFSSHIKDSAKLNYTLGLAYNNFLSKKPSVAERSDWRARENFFGINTNWMYLHKAETYNLDFDILYNGYKYGVEGDTNTYALDSGLVNNNTIVMLSPNVVTRLQNDRFKGKFGAKIAFDANNGVKARIYPDLELKYSMFNDIFIPYVGLTGGLEQTTFKSITRENAFVVPNIELRNESTAIDFFFGIKGSLSRRIGFNVGASFANVRNTPLFVTDTLYSQRNAFNVIYDTMNVTTIEGSVSYQQSEKLKIDAIGRFNSYSLLNNSYAWNLPQLQVILRGSYNLFDKFLINLDLDLEGGRKGLVYEDGPGVTLENGQYIVDLGFIADANLGLEYRYNNRISAFLQFNNLAAQQYQRWVQAPVQQFQVMGGLTFKF
ncbi:hypothetical protein N9Y60_02875 [Crocinitomicaceae bacterium]|nr:hypothetical protein [Crocinitomicaceae bacterium]MDB3906063.1 hypothetical protein [Crocinitomicaceae bacterium]